MIETRITVSDEEVKKRLGTLASKSGAVESRAANRSIATAKKVIKQETAKVYNVRQKDVEETLKTQRATASHPTAYLRFTDTNKNLYHFGKPSTLSPRNPIRSSSPYDPDPPYVTAQVMTAKGKKPLDGSIKPFVQISKKTGNIALFQRTSRDSRAPLRGVAAPAMPQIIKNDDVMARFSVETSKMFLKRLNHEIDQVLKGH